MAVRVGFEPTEPLPVHIFSKDALSTTQPPNRLSEFLRILIVWDSRLDWLSSQDLCAFSFEDFWRVCDGRFLMPGIRDTLLVIPAFNESRRLPQFLEELAKVLDSPTLRERVSVVVVDDGSKADESEKMAGACEKWKAQILVLEENVGKGGAVYAGWDQAAEDVVTLAFVDADGAVPAKEVARLMKLYLAPAGPGRAGAALYAVRQQEDTAKVKRTPLRRALGGVFRRIVRVLFRLPVPDTQCGFKIVPRSAYEQVKPSLQERKFIFDVELTLRLVEAAIPLRHQPVAWRESPGTTLRISSAVHMLWDLIALRMRA